MKDFKGTPGPWEIGYFVKSDVFANGGMKWVATLVSNELDGTYEDAANAKLISSAPDLLEALTQLVHLHMCEQEGVESGQPTSSMWIDAVNKASEALHKAVGGISS